MVADSERLLQEDKAERNVRAITCSCAVQIFLGHERRPGHQRICGRRRVRLEYQSEFQTLATATIVQRDLLYIHHRGDALGALEVAK